MIVGKQERSVLPDWTANRSAEFVSPERRPCDARPVIEERIRIKLVVPQEFIRASVIRIRAGFALNHSHRARSISVLCRKVTGEDSYFLDGIDSRNNNQVIQPQAFVVHPVNQVAVVPGLGTIDADTRVGASVICSASRKVWSGCCSTGLDRQQLRKASAIQRQIQNLSVIEQGRNSRGLGL